MEQVLGSRWHYLRSCSREGRHSIPVGHQHPGASMVVLGDVQNEVIHSSKEHVRLSIAVGGVDFIRYIASGSDVHIAPEWSSYKRRLYVCKGTWEKERLEIEEW